MTLRKMVNQNTETPPSTHFSIERKNEQIATNVLFLLLKWYRINLLDDRITEFVLQMLLRCARICNRNASKWNIVNEMMMMMNKKKWISLLPTVNEIT